MTYAPTRTFKNHEPRGASDSAILGVSYWDNGQINRMSSPSFILLVGLNKLHIDGEPLNEVLGDVQYGLHMPYIEGVLRGELHSISSDSAFTPHSNIKQMRFTYVPAFENSEQCGFYIELVDITVLLKVESNFKKYLYYFYGLFERSSHGIVLTNTEGTIFEFNVAFCKIIGYELDLARHIESFRTMSAQCLQREFKNLGDLSADGQLGPIESKLSRVDGCQVIVCITGRAIVLERKQHYICWKIEDISKSKLIDAQLKASKEVFKAVTDGVLITDEKGVLISVNPAFSIITGYRSEEMIGKTCAFLQGRNTDVNTVKAINFARESGDSFCGEILNYRKDGSFFWNELTIAPVRNDQGNVFQYVGIARDITDRKVAKENLEVAAVAFESREGIMITDADQQILRVNTAFTEITGYSVSDVKGKTPRMLSSGRHDELFYEKLISTLRRDCKWQGEIWNRRKNGEEYLEQLIITAVKDSFGKVTHYVGAFTDITEQKRTAEKIHQLAFFDQLTTLPNRQYLFDLIQISLQTSKENQQYGALLLVNLDHFMTLNDTLGHDVGDQLLNQVAANLVTSLSGVGHVARLGSDEFVILLQTLGTIKQDAADQASEIGTKLIRLLDRTYQLSNYTYEGTASIGITMFSGNAEDTFDELLKQIDLALHFAKSSGRNTMRFYAPQMQTKVRERVEIEADLRTAIRYEQFVLHYQPQIDRSGKLTGVEALVRWHCPKRGIVSPADFIPLLEENGLILHLGNWVIHAACEQLVSWASLPHLSSLTISVNMSARQLHQPDFVSQVLTSITKTGANPSRLELELTESLLLNDVENTIKKMTTLRKIGISFALDDFGTGYSSLSILKRLPIDCLKIDRSFVQEVPFDLEASAIVRAIVGLGNSLGLMMIAEGVETDQQFDFLKENGCDVFQGYFFSRPLSRNALQTYTNRLLL